MYGLKSPLVVASIAVVLWRLVRWSKIESSAVRPMRHRIKFVHKGCRVCPIEHLTIRIYHRCYIEGLLVAPLNLDGIDARIAQLIQVLQHAQILGVHDVGAAFVFLDWVILARARFFLKRILPAARLSTVARYPAAPRHIVAN